MPITLITGPANAGKAQVVMDAVRRELAHGLEPLLVVPTRADAEHYLRELAADRAAIGVRVLRFDGLIEEVAARAEVVGTALGGLARERLIAVLTERSARSSITGETDMLASAGRSSPGLVHASPGLVHALGTLFGELRVRCVSAARLTQALARWSAEDGTGVSREEIGAIFEQYSRTLERIGRLDGEQRAVRALDGLRRSPALWSATPVAFYGFDDLTRLQIDTIETLGRVVGAAVTVSLTYEPGRVAFAGRASTFAELLPLADEHRALPPRAAYYAGPSREALSHLERSLFETAGARVDPAGAVRLLEGGGERAELELLAREIAELLAGGMAAEEIALVVRTPGTSAELLEEVLAAADVPYALERRVRLSDTAVGAALIGLLRCVPAEAGASTTAELGDLLAWLRAPGLLEHSELADSLEARARRLGATSADRARALWQERHWQLDTIDQLEQAAARGPLALIDRATRELQWLFGAPRRGQAVVLEHDELTEARALAAGSSALAELRDLAKAAPELAPGSGPELARSLERVEVFSGQRPTPGAVAVLDPLALRARRVKALFVCGLQEGLFPARARPQPLLADEERRRLAEASGLRLGEHEDALAAERYLLYAAVSRPEELLVLSWHVADDDGEPTARSLFVDDICDLFTEALGERRARRPLGAVDAAAGALRIGPPEGSDGLSDERVLAELRERPWSASSLEQWIGCPMRWFVERVLHPGAFEPEPEPFARGGLAHAALKDTLEGLRSETGSARLTPARLTRARQLLREALEQGEAEYPLSVMPERRPGVRRRLQADLERYLEHAAETSGPLEPTFLEFGFGIGAEDERGEESSVGAFQLGPGVKMRGRIDRVDVSESGDAVVYDYKSSDAPAQAKWIGEHKLQVALYMLAVEQLLGLRVAGGFYQPLSGPDLRARGVLDGDSAVALDTVRGDTQEHERMRELLGEALDAALQAASQSSRGELEARPRTCAFRGGCEFPTICRCER